MNLDFDEIMYVQSATITIEKMVSKDTIQYLLDLILRRYNTVEKLSAFKSNTNPSDYYFKNGEYPEYEYCGSLGVRIMRFTYLKKGQEEIPVIPISIFVKELNSELYSIHDYVEKHVSKHYNK